MQTKTKVTVLKSAIHLINLAFIAQLYYLAILDQLGTDPVKEVIHATGINGLNLLLLTLCISPVAKRFKMGWLMQTRRLLGIYTFVYALLHLLNYIAFELQFDYSLLVSEIIKRPYITIGMVAISLLTPLAITSLKYYQRKMGRQWQSLHNWVYVIVILVCIHFYWSVKSDITEPVIYFGIMFTLLMLRRDKIKAWLKR